MGPVQAEGYPEGVQLVSGDVEKRNHVRFPVFEARVTYARAGASAGPFPVENLSRGGLAFVQPASVPALAPEQSLELVLTVAVLKQPLPVIGKVARIERLGESGESVSVGVQFLELSEETFQSIRWLEKYTIPESDARHVST